jgi:hypothetical protein
MTRPVHRAALEGAVWALDSSRDAYDTMGCVVLNWDTMGILPEPVGLLQVNVRYSRVE